MHKLTSLIARTLAWAGLAVLGQAQGFQAFHLTELDGLPSSQVYDVDVAEDGAVWFATRAGVARFDGIHWDVHGPGNGLDLGTGIGHLALGSDGTVWAVGHGARAELVRLRDGAWEHMGVVPRDLSDATVVALEVLPRAGGEDILLALGHGGNLLRRTVDGWAVEATDVRGFDLHDGGLVLATARGLERYVPGEGASSFPGPDTGPLAAVGVERSKGAAPRFWLLGPDWFGRLEAGQLVREVEKFGLGSGERLGSVQVQADGTGGVFVGDFHEVHLWDRGVLRRVDRSSGLVSAGSSDMDLDSFGNVWITTLRGVSRIPPRAWEVLDEDDGLLQSEVSAIELLDGGRMALGHNGGLSLLGPGGIEHHVLQEQARAGGQLGRVLDLEADGEGGLWLSANDLGLVHLPAGGELQRQGVHDGVRLGPTDDPAVGAVRAAEGGLWTVTNRSIQYQDAGVAMPIGLGPSRWYLRRAVAGPDRRILYACSSSGGLVVVEDGETRLHPGRESGESNVFAVAFPSEGPALVGTMAGLMVLGETYLETPPEELRLEVPIYSILEDSRGWLWFGTGAGVYRHDGTELRHFTVEDGLAGQEANRDALVELPDGRIAIGTSHGLALFDPLREWDFAPPVPVISEPESSGGDWRPGDPILAGSELHFHVHAVSFAGRANPELRYRVQGEEHWVEVRATDDGLLHFPGIDPGVFAIEVQARHEGGPWGPIVTSAPIDIRQVFWRTGWFVLIQVVVIGGFLAAAGALFLSGRQARRLEAELERRTAALRRTELRFERLFALDPAAQFLLEPGTGQVHLRNDAARELFGDDLGAPPAATLALVLEHLGAELEPEDLARVLEGLGGETQLELVGRTVDRVFELRSSRFALGDEDLVLVTLVDVSARRQLEESVRQAQALQAVGELAGGLAHDFNNLLTTILGQVELLRLDVPEHGDERLAAIQRSGLRGAELVRKLLAFGKRQVLKPEVVDLAPAVAEVTATLSDLLGESVHLEADLGARDLFVRVDPVEIERVVLNLCLNARDAMPGGGTIFVSVTPLPLLRVEPELPQGWVCLSVRDQGVGLTAEVRERMFEPFYTTKADPTGAGLGLASVHGVVGQSDGRVEVDSAPDQGTEIRVLLPRIEAPAAEVTTAAPVDVRPGEALRVLLVEDQPEVRRAVASLLRGLGHWPVEAEGGQEALDRLAADPAGVDLVLTDVMMPGMDGLELGERLGELHPDLPLVYMSGYVDRVDRAPEAAFLAKPFTVGELRGALEAARRRPTGV